jgi:hypothetical protein
VLGRHPLDIAYAVLVAMALMLESIFASLRGAICIPDKLSVFMRNETGLKPERLRIDHAESIAPKDWKGNA